MNNFLQELKRASGRMHTDHAFYAGATHDNTKELVEMERMADHAELLPVSPITRFNWPDGVNFDYSNDPAALRRGLPIVAFVLVGIPAITAAVAWFTTRSRIVLIRRRD